MQFRHHIIWAQAVIGRARLQNGVADGATIAVRQHMIVGQNQRLARIVVEDDCAQGASRDHVMPNADASGGIGAETLARVELRLQPPNFDDIGARAIDIRRHQVFRAKCLDGFFLLHQHRHRQLVGDLFAIIAETNRHADHAAPPQQILL